MLELKVSNTSGMHSNVEGLVVIHAIDRSNLAPKNSILEIIISAPVQLCTALSIFVCSRVLAADTIVFGYSSYVHCHLSYPSQGYFLL